MREPGVLVGQPQLQIDWPHARALLGVVEGSRPALLRSLPAPRTKELAAITVRPGQQIRAWGAWHAVRTVSTVRHATGGLAVVLGLDEGPPLRVPAAEPLAVRGLP
ncbi:hypothetical protein [Streptomyces virginiae]|uniref:hypothetical protein n=1 Tax=Streptomyces virginiae TaxID=1961 RepID=UPI003673C5CD